MKFRKQFMQALNYKNDYLKQAELLLNDQYQFIHPYDMECCKTAFHMFSNWDATPNQDDEWIFMRSRMGYLDSLCLMYEKSQNTKYLDKLIWLIDNFIDEHKILVPSKSTRTLDSGIRIVYIIKAIMYLDECNYISKSFMDKVQLHLHATCEYLKKHYITKYDASNWGVMIMVGIYSYGVYFKDQSLFDYAKQKLQAQLQTQVINGLHWENSILYHCMMIVYLCFAYMMKPELFIKEVIKSLSDSLKKLHNPRHEVINFGDSDVINCDSILSLSDTLLKQASNYPLTPESLMFGGEFMDDYLFENKNINHTTKFDCGYVHRLYNDFSFSFYCANMRSSHTHIDLLHFNYFNKTNVFVDKGRYTYQEHPLRNELKSLISHNSFVVDNKVPSSIKASWEYEKYPVVTPLLCKEKDEACIIEGSYFSNYFARRRVVLIKDIALIFDSIYYDGKHNVEHYFHLHPQYHHEVKLDFPQYNTIQTPYSACYNECIFTNTLTVNTAFNDKIHLAFKIFNHHTKIKELSVYRNGVVVDNQIAQSFMIEDENDSYIVFVKHDQIYENTKCFHVEGMAFVTNIKVLKKTPNGYKNLLCF